jgi:hypothetical protein
VKDSNGKMTISRERLVLVFGSDWFVYFEEIGLIFSKSKRSLRGRREKPLSIQIYGTFNNVCIINGKAKRLTNTLKSPLHMSWSNKKDV